MNLKNLTQDELIAKAKKLLEENKKLKKIKKVKKTKKVKKVKKAEIKDVLQVNLLLKIKIEEDVATAFGKFKKKTEIRTYKESFITKDIQASKAEIEKKAKEFVDDFMMNKHYSSLLNYQIVSTKIIPFVESIKQLPLYLQNYIENNSYSHWKPKGLHPNCCIDYLLEMYQYSETITGYDETLKKSRYAKKYTKDKIFEIINRHENDVINNGFTVKDFKIWCEFTRQNLYVFDALKGVVERQICDNKDKNLASIMLIISCKHIYPINNKSVRTQLLNIMSTSGLYIEKEDDEEINDISMCMMKNNPEKIYNFVMEISKAKSIYIYIETDDLMNVHEHFIKNKLSPRSYGYENKITLIQLDEVRIYANENINDCLEAWQKLGIKGCYVNQSLSMIVNKYVSHLYGSQFIHSRTSANIDFKCDDFKIIAPSYRNDSEGYLDEYDENQPELSDIGVYDLHKAHPSALFNNKYDFPVYYETDNIQEYDGNSLLPGFYYVNTNKSNILLQGAQFYPYNLVQYCLDNGVIEKTNIKYQYLASRTIPFDFFKLLINNIWNTEINEKLKKKLLVNFCGSLYKNNIMKKQKIHFTNDFYEACYIYHKYAGESIIDNSIGFNVHYCDYTVRENSDSPIYLHMIGNTRIALYELYKQLINPQSQLLIVNSDCLVINKPNSITKDDRVFGGYKKINELPKKPVNQMRFYRNELANNKPILTWNIVDVKNNKDIDLVPVMLGDDLIKSFILVSPPGYGKSYFIKQYIKQLQQRNIHFELLAPSHISKLNLECDQALTIQKYFFTKNYMSKIHLFNTKVIIVDEISQVSRQYLKKLLICKKYGVEIVLCGDYSQLPPVDGCDEEYNYFESDMIKSLCDCNCFKFNQYHRGDMQLLEILNKINNNEKEIDWKLFGNKKCMMNICYTNEKRKQINKEWMDKEKGNKFIYIEKNDKSDYSQDMYVYEGLPVICYKNTSTMFLTTEGYKSKIYNNEKFFVKSISKMIKNKECIEIHNGEFGYYIESKMFNLMFLPMYATTTHKIQGATLSNDFSIHELSKMLCDSKLFYTAVSRAKTLKQVNLIW
jgi:hypothetical protein